jgi:hypothetical protein
MVKKFWIVLCPTKGSPTKEYHSKEEAIQEAVRLAHKNGSCYTFFVFELIGQAKLPSVTYEEIQ